MGVRKTLVKLEIGNRDGAVFGARGHRFCIAVDDNEVVPRYYAGYDHGIGIIKNGRPLRCASAGLSYGREKNISEA
jgi:hypothetical protein